MKYTKQAKKQLRKQAMLKKSQEKTNQRVGMRRKSSNNLLVYVLLIVGFIANASELSALASELF